MKCHYKCVCVCVCVCETPLSWSFDQLGCRRCLSCHPVDHFVPDTFARVMSYMVGLSLNSIFFSYFSFLFSIAHFSVASLPLSLSLALVFGCLCDSFINTSVIWCDCRCSPATWFVDFSCASWHSIQTSPNHARPPPQCVWSYASQLHLFGSRCIINCIFANS